ncbi:Cytochrome P450 71BL1 [Vitis vinifera]|uniref:Cytochrome P450 71BL1 n=1 Tax=Vitis vinifera TaxID=29760 RepID=A0A438EFB1_VITVI|nr:Cytochrome P450 71BL1 [Vitis vinifera]
MIPLCSFVSVHQLCIVVSNVTIAKQVMETHELAFASRLEFGSSDHFIYKGSKFIMAEYGPYWRFMKKLCLTKLLAAPTSTSSNIL